MKVALIAFLSAIALAGVAAWFSITGLMAIFAALPWQIAIMASVLEVAKLVTASILYRHWKTIPRLMKSYLTVSVVILMLITSLGIFGYLSKAHLDQNAPVSNNIAKIERLELRIDREEKAITDAETVILQLDGAVTVLIEYDKISGPDGSRAVRAGQQDQRNALNEMIDLAQEKVDNYLDEKFTHEQEVREYETEVGPIKYIAALAYDDPASHYDTAVRAIILLLVFVFDPLAVFLLVTANHIQMQTKLERERKEPDTIEDIFDVEEDMVTILDDEEFEAFERKLEEPAAPNENLQRVLNTTPPWEQEPVGDPEGEPVQEPEEPPSSVGVNQFTSLIELQGQSTETIENILSDIAALSNINPLDQSGIERRNAIAHILTRRTQRSENPLHRVNRIDKNIG